MKTFAAPTLKLRAFACLVFAFSALGLTTADAKTTKTIKESLDAAPGGALLVDVDSGGISVSTADTSQVSVEIICRLKQSGDYDESALREMLGLQITKNGNTIEVRAERPPPKRWRDLDGIEYKIVVPEKFEADLRTSGGGIRVAGLTGQLKANTSGGGLHFQNINGDIDGRTSGGGIDLGSCIGEVTVHTSGGGITARDGKGSLSLKTSGGGIHVETHDGDVNAKTSGGGISIRNIAGNLDAHTSGGSIDATLLEQPTADCRLHTSGGGITVYVPSTIAVNLEAQANAGGVNSELPVTVLGKVSKSRLNGTINGGGPLLALEASAGSVNIKAR